MRHGECGKQKDSDAAKWKSATLKTLLHQQSVTYRLTFKRTSVGRLSQHAGKSNVTQKGGPVIV